MFMARTLPLAGNGVRAVSVTSIAGTISDLRQDRPNDMNMKEENDLGRPGEDGRNEGHNPGRGGIRI
jgi:hypothetical protein